jgi:hypothetical protein
MTAGRKWILALGGILLFSAACLMSMVILAGYRMMAKGIAIPQPGDKPDECYQRSTRRDNNPGG